MELTQRSATLDQLDCLCTYIDDKTRFAKALYRAPKPCFSPRARRCGPVVWVVKDGKPVEFEEKRRKKNGKV